MTCLQEVMDQHIGNSVVLKIKINKINTLKIKMLFIKWYNKEKLKLKGFFI